MELGDDAKPREQCDEASRVVFTEVARDRRLRRRDVRKRLAHVLRHPCLIAHGLGVHRVVVVDRVDESNVEPVALERSIQRIADDGAAQPRDRYRTGRSLRVADDVRPSLFEEPRLLVGPEGRIVP
jgi:hypothetical protein